MPQQPEEVEEAGGGPTPPVADEADDARLERVLRDLAVANDCTPDDEPGLPAEPEEP